jgi:hypothetical protein
MPCKVRRATELLCLSAQDQAEPDATEAVRALRKAGCWRSFRSWPASNLASPGACPLTLRPEDASTGIDNYSVATDASFSKLALEWQSSQERPCSGLSSW